MSALFTSKSGARQAVLPLLPVYMQSGSYIIILAAGCGGAVDQFLYLLFTFVPRNIFGSRIPNSLVAKALISLRIAIGTLVLIFSFIQYYDSSKFHLRAQGAGHFTIEAWTCQTQNRIGDEYAGDFGRLLLSVVLLGVEFWAGGRSRGQGGEKGEDEVQG
ncbi:hypothetical protein LSUE1_G002378, partial [Lachnellula suecica]